MKKDFSKATYRNPRRQKEEKKKLNTRRYSIIFGVLIILAGLVYLFFFSPVFKINKIIISGTNKADWQAKIEQMIKDQQQQTLLVTFLQQANIILFNSHSLKQKILNNFDLEAIQVIKNYPKTLKIELKQKKPALIWRSGNNFYAVNQQGVLIKSISIDDLEFDLPTVSFNTTTDVSLNQSIIQPEKIQFIQNSRNEIKKNFKNWELNKFRIDQLGSKHIKAYTNQNWYIYFNSELDLTAQINNLKRLIKEKIKDTTELEYIDLRLRDRLFYK